MVGSFRGGRALIAVVIGLIVAVAMATTGPAGSVAETTNSSRPSVGIIVAVDESGSLSPDDLDAERNAAAAVLQLPYASLEIRAFGGLIGFNRNAEPICPSDATASLPELPLVDAQSCVSRLTSGGDTNHAAAIRLATSMLNGGSTKGADSKILILMTDGRCDSTGEGSCDEAQVAGAVAEAKAAQVQIWPVAFGEIDRARMDQYANGGAGPNRRCTSAEAPSLIETADPASLSLSLLDVIRKSSCGLGVISGRDSLRVDVSPLLTKLVLEVTNPSGVTAAPTIHDTDGAPRDCEGRANPAPNVVTCTFVDPTPAGSWDASASGSLIVALQQGRVSLTVDGCDAGSPIPDRPSVSADAGRPVDWSKVDDTELAVGLTGAVPGGAPVQLRPMDPPSGRWTTPFVSAAAGSPGTLKPQGTSTFKWLDIQTSACEFAGSPAPVIPTNTGGSFPWPLLLLVVLLVGLVAIALLARARRRRRLPNATIHLRNTMGMDAIPMYVAGSLRWTWDIDWDGPSIAPVVGRGEITVTRIGRTGLLQLTGVGVEATEVEFDTEFPIVRHGERKGYMRIEKQNLAPDNDLGVGDLFGGSDEGAGASTGLFG